MSEFLELAAQRRSVRAYADRPVEREKILRCLEAARLAPSACNSQPWRFIVVDEPELKDRVATCTVGRVVPMNGFARQAPVLVVVVMERANLTCRFGSLVKGKSFPLIDIGIATEHFCLQATEEGLGTCIIGWFDERRIRRLLEVPRRSRPILVLTLGYPAEASNQSKKRKPLNEIASWNRHQDTE